MLRRFEVNFDVTTFSPDHGHGVKKQGSVIHKYNCMEWTTPKCSASACFLLCWHMVCAPPESLWFFQVPNNTFSKQWRLWALLQSNLCSPWPEAKVLTVPSTDVEAKKVRQDWSSCNTKFRLLHSKEKNQPFKSELLNRGCRTPTQCLPKTGFRTNCIAYTIISYWQFIFSFAPHHTCQPVRLKIPEIQFFWTLRSHSSKPPPPKAKILAYLSSTQQYLSNEPQENIRKPTVTILTLNSDS